MPPLRGDVWLADPPRQLQGREQLGHNSSAFIRRQLERFPEQPIYGGGHASILLRRRDG